MVAHDQARSHECVERGAKVLHDCREQMQDTEIGRASDQSFEDGAFRGIAMIVERHETIDGHEKSLEVGPMGRV